VTVWTTPAEVLARLRRRWDSGELLRSWGCEKPWEPLALGIRGPTAGEIAAQLGAVQRWAATWERVGPHLRVERRRVGGRLVGANEIPAKVWVDGYKQGWAALGVTADADRFSRALVDTRRRAPKLVNWLLTHPMRVLNLGDEWPSIVDTVLWIDTHAVTPVYLREVDVPGVDTKFIERHRAVLADLLDHQLDPDRIDTRRSASDFAARYRFRTRPTYLRLRTLDPTRPLAGGYSELSVPSLELAERPPPHGTVYIVENETSYLAFPPVPDALALFGGGYAVSTVAHLTWLRERPLNYWSDIDTHGFTMLDRLRSHFPHTQSILMDRTTLLNHERQWVREPKQAVAHLAHLSPDEADLYRDLVEDALGPSIRLEQERISYAAVQRAARGASVESP
jgi:hypothetical protein